MAELPPPPDAPPPPPAENWQTQPAQQVVVKQGPGCLKITLVAVIILVILGAGVVGCLALAGNEVAKEIDKAIGTASSDDYELSEGECHVDGELGLLKASGKIKNTSDKPQAFQITIRWETEDGDLITDDPKFTNKLDVGQSQAWETTSLETAPEGAKPTCSVRKVEYSIFE